MIPKYINCANQHITKCDFYLHKDCPNTCSYAKDMDGVGIGAMIITPREITKELSDKLFKEDMQDY